MLLKTLTQLTERRNMEHFFSNIEQTLSEKVKMRVVSQRNNFYQFFRNRYIEFLPSVISYEGLNDENVIIIYPQIYYIRILIHYQIKIYKKENPQVFKYLETSRSSIALNSTPPFKTILNRFERSPSHTRRTFGSIT